MCIRRLHPLLLVLCLTCGPTRLRADYATAFTTPPHVPGGSIIGKEGWDYRLPPKEDQSATARVVAVRWNGYRPALMLKGANLKNAFPPTTGDLVTLRFTLACTFPDMGGTGKQFRLGFIGAPMGEIFMDLGAEGGLGYAADGSGRGGVVVLKKSEMRVNSFYSCEISIDYAARTYDIRITGQKRDAADFVHEVKGAAFDLPKARAVTGLYLLGGGSITAYLGALEVKSSRGG